MRNRIKNQLSIILHYFQDRNAEYLYFKVTEPLYHYFMFSLVLHLSGNYPLPAMHSLLVTINNLLTIYQGLHIIYFTFTIQSEIDKSD